MAQLVTTALALAVGHPALAQAPSSMTSPSDAAVRILEHLDLDSFRNSTGPRRNASAHTPAEYGLVRTQGFDDGWAQVSEADDSWHMGALILERGKGAATICFTDSAGSGGTYRSTQVLRVTLTSTGRWAAVEIADRKDRGSDRSVAGRATGAFKYPAEMLQRLDDFRAGLAARDRHRLDRVLPRDADGGIASCDDGEGSRASCEAAAYMPALRQTGLLPRFLATLGAEQVGTSGNTGNWSGKRRQLAPEVRIVRDLRSA